MMRNFRKLVLGMLGAGLILLIVASAFPLLFARASNCGGNSAALTFCKGLAISARGAVFSNNIPDFSSFDDEQRTNIVLDSMSHWTTGANYWVRTNQWLNQKSIVVFCDMEYGNVPQPTIWNLYRKNPAHAVAFADGSSGIISLRDFEQLDRTNFAVFSHLILADE